MPLLTSTACTAAQALFAAIGISIGGCAVGDAPIESAGLSCVDDSPRCVAERQSALKDLVADPQRRWIKEPASPAAYASGVRMFAYKQKKRELTCEELAHGQREASGAASSLKGAGSQLTPAQVSRGTMFAGEVGRELANEAKRRCKSG
jgi:hypothetical protein